MTTLRVAAVDLGATSGRVMAGVVGPGTLELEEVHRFPNGAVRVAGAFVWDVVGLYREVLAGLVRAAAGGEVAGIGIDSWAVDYGLVNRDGSLVGIPFSHRDPRVNGVAEKVSQEIGDAELYEITGIQRLPFNTLYQLVASRGTEQLESADTLLMIPDLLAFWLTGVRASERTNASTTQLYDVRSGSWAYEIAQRAGIATTLLPRLRSAGEELGRLRPEVAADLGFDAPVIAVGTHDTASAVVGVPAEGERHAYISSGTWSLLGFELREPVLTDAAREANFTNEVGVDGTIRFLKNVMGLWVLNESVRAWGLGLDALLAAAAERPGGVVIDIDHPSLLAPGTAGDSMPDRVAALVAQAGHAPLDGPAATTRCILDSLAAAYARHLAAGVEIAGHPVDVLHVVGGGSQNALLCQLTADACGIPVLAGPVEAAALGNVLVQARALGADLPDLAAMRALIRETHPLRRYEPRRSR